MNGGLSLLPELPRTALVPVLLIAAVVVLILLKRALGSLVKTVLVGVATTFLLLMVLNLVVPFVDSAVSTNVASPGLNVQQRLFASIVILILIKGVMVSVFSVIDTAVPDETVDGGVRSVFDDTEVRTLVELLAYWSIFTLALLDGFSELVLATMGMIVGATLDLLHIRLSRRRNLSRRLKREANLTGLLRMVPLYVLMAATPVAVLVFVDALPSVTLTAVAEVKPVRKVIPLLTSKVLIEGLSSGLWLETVLYLAVFATALVFGSTNLAFAFAGLIVGAAMQGVD